jgi:response regulator RpfG family c-di-GMP phosphodiesterase
MNKKMETKKVLLVDDEKNVLEAYRRNLRRHSEVETALGGNEGLETISEKGPFAVVISDLRMPGMDGVQFLTRVRDIAPKTVRMILTGHADLQNAIDAVNEGYIFRFLTKPCATQALINAISDGIRQYQLVTAEKVLLEKTLNGSIKALCEVLAFTAPEALANASRITRYVLRIAERINYPEKWQLETAARLSLIGCVMLPEEIIQKVNRGLNLSSSEQLVFQKHPSFASRLISHIPRMEVISEIIYYQNKRFDGSGPPEETVAGEDIPLGSRILKLVLDFDSLEAEGNSREEAVEILEKRTGWYDPRMVEALKEIVETSENNPLDTTMLPLEEVKTGMILAEDIFSPEGQPVFFRGQDIGTQTLVMLKQFIETHGLSSDIRVMLPQDDHLLTT